MNERTVLCFELELPYGVEYIKHDKEKIRCAGKGRFNIKTSQSLQTMSLLLQTQIAAIATNSETYRKQRCNFLTHIYKAILDFRTQIMYTFTF
jgi:hypothetical protein